MLRGIIITGRERERRNLLRPILTFTITLVVRHTRMNSRFSLRQHSAHLGFRDSAWPALPVPQYFVEDGSRAVHVILGLADPAVVGGQLDEDAAAFPGDDLLIHVARAAGHEHSIREVGPLDAKLLLQEGREVRDLGSAADHHALPEEVLDP